MPVQREHVVSLVICLVAILTILGGYASFSGLATANSVMLLQSQKDTFKQSDVLDVTLTINPMTILADETVTIYLDGEAIGAVLIRQYLDDNAAGYATSNLGGNEIITLNQKTLINLAEYITLETIASGNHIIETRLSGDAYARFEFDVV